MRGSTVAVVGAGVSAPVPVDRYANPPSISVQTIVSPAAVVDYAVEATADDINAPGYNPATGNWFGVGISAMAVSNLGGIFSLCTAVRLNVSASNGTVTMTVRQAGGTGAS